MGHILRTNNRFMDNLAGLQDTTPVRALDPTGKDLELLQTISNPGFQVAGFTNKMLRHDLSGTSFKWAAIRQSAIGENKSLLASAENTWNYP